MTQQGGGSGPFDPKALSGSGDFSFSSSPYTQPQAVPQGYGQGAPGASTDSLSPFNSLTSPSSAGLYGDSTMGSAGTPGWVSLVDDRHPDMTLYLRIDDIRRIDSAKSYFILHIGKGTVNVSCSDPNSIVQLVLMNQVSKMIRGVHGITRVTCQNLD